MNSIVDSTYFRNCLAKLRKEYDDQLQADGDKLKHARAMDIIRAVTRDFTHAQKLGRDSEL